MTTLTCKPAAAPAAPARAEPLNDVADDDASREAPSRPGWRAEAVKLAWIALALVALYFLPVGNARFDGAVAESMHMARAYAREHVLLCLVPALFIAGAIGVFVSQGSVMRYLGAAAPKPLAYGVASVSGTILAVCSCTVLPLFAGIWRMGAGLGPATAFLYSGPAINVLAIILTARVLGVEMGVARTVGAVGFSVVVGLLMHLIYRKEERVKAMAAAELPEPPAARPLRQTAAAFALMVAVLVLANWARPQAEAGPWAAVHAWKWPLTSAAAVALALALVRWFALSRWKVTLAAAVTAALALALPGEPSLAFAAGCVGLVVVTATGGAEARAWFDATWAFAKQIVPLLLAGVLVAGFLLGRPGHEGVIPSHWVSGSVGGNGLAANFVASFAGAFMYFATLTEVPVLQGLMGSGMGKGPALALLLAGPALSLPSMLVLRKVMGTGKTAVYVALVVVVAALSGWLYGAFLG